MAHAANNAAGQLSKKLPMRAKLGYGTIGLGTIANTMLATWQAFFYTTFCGIDISVAGFIVSIGTIVAAFTAPVWGYISDRMYSNAFGRKFGRRRATLLLTAPGQFVFLILQFVPGLPVWAYAASNLLYWIFNGGYSTVQYVLPSEMSDSSSQRAQLVGVNQISTAVASIALATLNTALFVVWGDKNWQSYFNLALIYDVFMLVIVIAGVFTIQERPYDPTTDFAEADSHDGEKVSLPKRIGLLLWNYVSTFAVKEFRNYLGMYLSEVMFRNVRGAILTYFLVFVLGLTSSQVSLQSGISFAVGIALVAFFMWLNSKIGSSKSYRVGAIEAIVVFLLMFGLAKVRNQIGQAATIVAWIVLALALNFGITGVVNATDFAYSFIPDVDEILTGKRREGQYASVNSTIDNIFMAIEKIVITQVLAWGGFVSGAESQPPQVVELLTNIFCFAPIFFCLLGIYFTHKVKLNEQNRLVLAAEINRLREGGSKANVEPETRRLVEELTGFSYEHCWGNNRVVNFSKKVEGESSSSSHTPTHSAA